ncbi:Spermine oxidase [Armadillidium nasatum]|uniref:Spermine oxidase n=1 Tax=Armadillidium nasatum TaxID=96803 RepID=A0A5N5TLT2_9CRUS|nr:Spermine oxidase [Armadillidium nasatum]
MHYISVSVLNMASTNIYKALIIGGGAAGLSAINKLHKNGVKNCLLLEAQATLGGRISTILRGDHFLEHGAQWIHGEDGNVVYSFAKENNLLDEERNLKQTGVGDTVFIKEDSSIVDEDVVRIFQMQMANLREEGERNFEGNKDSVGNYYTQKFREENELGEIGNELLDWYGRFQCCMDGTDTWFEASCVGSAAYEECPGNQVINLSEGFKSLVTHFQNNLPEELIRLNSPVKKIRWKNLENSEVPSLVELELISGEVFKGEHVIITSSLAVLKDCHEVLFEPQLPLRKVNAINGLGIDVVDKIFIEFPHIWWGDRDGFSFLRDNPQNEVNETNWEKGILGFYEVYNQSQILCAWLTGKAAKEMEKASEEEVKDRCMALLRQYLGSHYDIPDPVWWDRTRWFSNPYIKGSYSFRSVLSEELDVTAEDLAYPLCNDQDIPVVCFGGEATHEKYYSTVHGAVETGWREADRIIALRR